ncbi:hypothetical protein EYD10_15975 [Varanus komodoensis]|nr:hypothetical protein EYD10_15975 [Varanus komodoensis]
MVYDVWVSQMLEWFLSVPQVSTSTKEEKKKNFFAGLEQNSSLCNCGQPSPGAPVANGLHQAQALSCISVTDPCSHVAIPPRIMVAIPANNLLNYGIDSPKKSTRTDLKFVSNEHDEDPQGLPEAHGGIFGIPEGPEKWFESGPQSWKRKSLSGGDLCRISCTWRPPKGVGRSVCPVCSKGFTRKSSLNRHLIIHTGEKPYKCSNCGKSFNRKTNLIAHEVIHSEEKLYQCADCGETFKPKWGITAYQMDHTGEKVYKCSACKKSFRQRAKAVRGVMLSKPWKEAPETSLEKQEHGKKEDVSSNQNELERGLDNEMGEKFVIGPSGDLDTIKAPPKLYKGKRRSPCPVCGKIFATQSSVNRHQRIHTGEKPFKCTDCGKSFNQKTSLLTHVVIHTEQKPHQCSDCGKSFRHSSGLLVHQRMHTGEKPYNCSVCWKSFSQRAHVIKHIVRKHTREKPLACPSQTPSS